MIADTITKQIGQALKAKDEIRLSTLRLLSSALNYEFIAKQHKLSEEEELVVVKKEAKKRKEAIEAYEKAGAQERADKEKKELEILSVWLPAQMPNEEVESIVADAISQTGATSIADMGKVMGTAMAKIAGRADGTKVSEMVKQKLSNL